LLFHKLLLDDITNQNLYWRRISELKKKILGGLFVLLSIVIISVSAFVYESAPQTVGQTVKEIATITLKSSALGNIEEGETQSYTKDELATLGAAISTTTSKADVYLHFNSNIDSLGSCYTTYTITVKYITVPGGSSKSVGAIACEMTLASPDPAAVTLDVAGSWVFDFEVTTTAKLVSSDQATSATITVTAEST
jgi:hypothetical protein